MDVVGRAAKGARERGDATRGGSRRKATLTAMGASDYGTVVGEEFGEAGGVLGLVVVQSDERDLLSGEGHVGRSSSAAPVAKIAAN